MATECHGRSCPAKSVPRYRGLRSDGWHLMLQRCSGSSASEHLDRLYPFALSIFRAWTLSSHCEPFLHNLPGRSFKKDGFSVSL